MIVSLFLLDVAPDPVSGPVIGIAGVILIVVIVLMLVAATIVGLVFLLKWFMRKSRRSLSPSVSESSAQPVPPFQPSSPNQP